MGTATYLIAKYVPDLFRNEPINIGVVVWVDGGVVCRFLGQREDGAIDGRSLSSQVSSVQNYKSWVEMWCSKANSDRLVSRAEYESVLKSDPKFLDVLAESGKGNYVIEKGGEILEEVNQTNASDVLDFLFRRLVESGEKKWHTPARVHERASELMALSVT